VRFAFEDNIFNAEFVTEHLFVGNIAVGVDEENIWLKRAQFALKSIIPDPAEINASLTQAETASCRAVHTVVYRHTPFQVIYGGI
jgi:hypothetical protein